MTIFIVIKERTFAVFQNFVIVIFQVFKKEVTCIQVHFQVLNVNGICQHYNV